MSKITLQDERGFNQIFAPVGSTPVRMRRRHDWFVTKAKAAGARRVLELGCGTGETAAYIARNSDAEVVALDVSTSFIDVARSRHRMPNLRFELFDLLNDGTPPFGTFDMVCGNGILHHLVTQLPMVLTSLRRLTKAGGILAFIEPNFLNPYCAFIFGTRAGRRWARLEPDEMAFTPGQLRRMLPEAGWQDVSIETRDFLVPGLPTSFIKPIQLLEPPLEANMLTRWLAQSHFVNARV